MAWQRNGTPDTLTGTAASVDISDLLPLKFNFYLYHQPTAGATAGGLLTFDGNITGSYAFRNSVDGAADTTAINQTSVPIVRANNIDDEFVINYHINISGEEKLFFSFAVDRGNAGAANSPFRQETVSKFVITAGQTTQITITDSAGADLPVGTNLSALGTD